ncbi:LuxR C-terminal-related transcriptional regulator [Streptomyces sp. NBC_01190]|uniref:LuxR C-terminal-related transcriptional regulator n=1 Tax=Streptomyces sp. NBC_01190 TaxID=2903767 RepID=UPI00386C1848|nr:helix-turn-helix transcriptional regulator [Streptomyces sp. NBC_01190]
MGEYDLPDPTSQPSPEETTVYDWIVSQETTDAGAAVAAAASMELSAEQVKEALVALEQRGLLHPVQGDSGRIRVVDPALVAAVITDPIERVIRDETARLQSVRAQFAALRERYLDGQRPKMLPAELIPRVEEVRAALNRASAECTEEILSSQPGGSRNPRVLEEALARDRDILERGVRMRTLYHHTARFNGPSQSYVAALSGLGAEYRTAHELFGRLIVFDRKVAFIPEAGDAPPWGGVLIREPSIVHFLCDIFEQTWTKAEPYSDAAADGLEVVSRDIDRTIARLLAAGLKDETIARRLGMSLRTTRRHIADIMESVGAESRFQAGVLMATRGLLGPPGRRRDDDPPAAGGPPHT